MPETPLTLERVHEINLRAITRYAEHLDEMEGDLYIHEEDVGQCLRYRTGPKILDAGCGSGRYGPIFACSGMDYVGVDYSAPMVEQARLRNPDLTFEVMSYHKLGFEDETFDCIWACHTFGFEPKVFLQGALAELRRVLKTGGLLVVVLPFANESNDELREDVPFLEAFYFSTWTFDEFLVALEEAGFTIIDGGIRRFSGSMSFVVQK